MTEFDFDMQAAWLRRFSSDAASNLGAFAHRLKEAMPDSVLIEEKKGLFAKTGTVVAVTVDLGQNRYRLTVDKGRLQASIAMVVRGITLSTKPLAPAEWFAKLAEETTNASAHAQSLSQSLQRFMEG
jgi:uncharacterized protein (DUF1684 family)